MFDLISKLRFTLIQTLGKSKHACRSVFTKNDFVKKIIFEGDCVIRFYKFFVRLISVHIRAISLTLLLGLSVVLPISVQAITITNTATVSSDLGVTNDSVDVVTVLPPTPSTLVAYQYAPTAAGTSSIFVSGTQYSPSGSLTGPFNLLPQPETVDGTAITVPSTLDLLPINVIKGGETLFIGLTETDHNTSSLVVETLVVQVSTTSGDTIVLELVETGADTGVFAGYVQTTLNVSGANDNLLSVVSNETITVTYSDIYDNTDTSTLNVLVDPLGIVFNSSSGSTVDGAQLTLIDLATGLPATVFGDDGTSFYPATITSGGSATDASGTVYNFPPGGYRFPLIAPGNYRLDIVPPAGFNAPSTVATAQLQALPGAPFAIVTGSRGENFAINPGPPVRIDIPMDSVGGDLFLVKKATKETVSVGEFAQYKISVSNTGLGNLSNVALEDTLPEGFRYQAGSAKWGGNTLADPSISEDGRQLIFNVGGLPVATTTELSYVVAVSSGAFLGKAVNQVTGTVNGVAASNTAMATVLVADDFMRSENIIMGRVMMGDCEAALAEEGQVTLSLKTNTRGGKVIHTLDLNVDKVSVNDLVVEVRLPGALEYVPGSSIVSGKASPDPEIFGGQLKFHLGDPEGEYQRRLEFESKAKGIVFGEFKIRAVAFFKSMDGIAQSTPVADNVIRDYSRILRPRFETLSAELKAQDMVELDGLAAQLFGHEISRIHIIGHSDKRKIRHRSRSLYANNQELSLARANSVGNYLKNKLGLSDKQINISGKGDKSPVFYNQQIQQQILSRAEKLALSRRVEVLVEMKNAEDRFLVEKSSSGIQSTPTVGLPGELSKAGLGLGNAGIPNVRLYMEDGRFVDTDEQGHYHFEGLKLGAHLVQVDLESLPDHLEIYSCEKNTRFAGTPYSRFVDNQGGTLWRSDFYVREKLPDSSTHALALQMKSRQQGNQFIYQLDLNSDFEKINQETLIIDFPKGLKFISDSSRLNKRKIPDPEIKGNNLIFNLAREKLANQNTLIFKAEILPSEEGEYIISAIMNFKNSSNKFFKSDRVDNTFVRQYENLEKKVFQAHFEGFDAELGDEELEALKGIVDYLLGEKIRYLKVNGYANEITRENKKGSSIFDSNEILASERAMTIKRYLLESLRLLPEQIQISGYSALDMPDEKGRYVEILALLAKGHIEQRISIGESDSGLKTSSYQQIDKLDKVDIEAEEKAKTISDDRKGILNITEGKSIANPVGHVNVRLDARLKPVLLVDGEEVPDYRIGMKLFDKETNLSFYNYIGVDFGEPGKHTLTLKGMGPFGNARFEQSVEYVRTGEIAEIKVIDVQGNIADGKTPVKVKLALYDQRGEIIRAGAELLKIDGDLEPFDPEALENNSVSLPELKTEQTLVKVNPEGQVLFAPVTNSGLHTIKLEYNGASALVKTYVKPVYREWIMVGLAESTLAYNDLKDNMQSLEAADIEEHFYNEGRLAFFSKGKIKGNYLLTLAYDSDREEEDVNNGLFGSIDPDKYYTLYGDNTEVGYDAPSTEKLYLKLESDKFYAMFGDYNTGLTVTELSRYSRSLTGFKGEYQGERVSAQVFAADNKQAFVRDEIQGDGTSGLYRLSNKNIVLNSEKITIETRDRFRSHIILESRNLTRYIDYNFDPVSGTVYFKQPIYSRDESFNPVYIVVDYETQSSGGDSITAGGRLAVSLDDRGSEVAVTAIQDDTSGAEGELLGADLKLKAGKNTEVKLELAETKNTVAGDEVKGSAYIAEVSRKGKSYDGKVYVREQEGDFGLGQQNGSETASRKMGLEAVYNVNDKLKINSEIYRDENSASEAERDMVSLNADLKEDNYEANVGLRHARDSYKNGDQFDSSIASASVGRHFINKRLKAKAGAEMAVGDNENPDYPSRLTAGLDYALNGNINLFAQQEFSFGEFEDTQNTRIGMESSPWSGAQINTNVEQAVNEYGPRRFANFGLTQTWQVNPALSFDAGLDRSVSLDEKAPVSFNINAAPASGPGRDDFTAVSLGATYKQALWSLMSRVEHRAGDLEDKSGVLMGFFRQQGPGFGLSSELSYFDSDMAIGARSLEAELELSLAWRPIDSRWIILNKAVFSENQVDDGLTEVSTSKFVNNLNTNYLFNRENQLALAHGYKKINDQFDALSYSGTSQFLGAEYRHDFNAKWDAGLQTSLLFTDVGNNRHYSYGASVGYNLARNMWFSLGYNIKGFEDDDFSAAAYSSAGTYLKFRVAFDHLVTREALAWWEKR